jgi:hypothetical protein
VREINAKVVVVCRGGGENERREDSDLDRWLSEWDLDEEESDASG